MKNNPSSDNSNRHPDFVTNTTPEKFAIYSNVAKEMEFDCYQSDAIDVDGNPVNSHVAFHIKNRPRDLSNFWGAVRLSDCHD